MEQEEKAAEVSYSITVKYLSCVSRVHSDGQLTVVINLIQAEARKQAQAAAAEQKRAAAAAEQKRLEQEQKKQELAEKKRLEQEKRAAEVSVWSALDAS